MADLTLTTFLTLERAGRPTYGSFALDGQEFVALNGGPVFQFTPAISFVVNCETQEEVDELWDKLCADGKDRHRRFTASL